MTARAVCQMCSWSGRASQGRAWAVWHWTFVDGTSQLLCGRHKAQAMSAGGFGEPLAGKPDLVFAPTSIDPAVANASRPRAFLDQVRDELRGEMQVLLRDYMSKVMLQIHVDDRNQTPGGSADGAKTQAKRRAS